MAESEIREARLEEIRFHAPSSGFLVGQFLMRSDDLSSFTAIGILNAPVEGRWYRLTGQMTVHPRYGEQFSFARAERTASDPREALKEIFRSSSFAGAGDKSAEITADALGEGALEKLLADPDLIDTVEGLNARQREAIRSGLHVLASNDRISVELMKMGLSDRQLDLLSEIYGPRLSDVILEDCFIPFYEIRGFRYASSVLIADGLDMPQGDPRCLEAMVYHTVADHCYSSGDTWMGFQDLLIALPGIGQPLLCQVLDALCEKDRLVIDEGRIATVGLYSDEVEIAWRLKEHLVQEDGIPAEQIEEEIANVEKELAIAYDEKQKEAMRQFFRNPLMILNGGPGTGKSTVVKGILMLCRKFYPSASVQLCAPTGKASKRLKQLSSSKARTIHSLLGWEVNTDEFACNETSPLEFDIVIVDEFSMVDTHLFASLLRALPSETRLLLIGDEDQLESVGPGKVFNDMIDSGTIPTVTLQTIFRQKNGSGIVSLAQQVRKEEVLTYTDGVCFEQQDAAGIRRRVEEIVRESFDPQSVQVLAPIYKGQAGIDALNKVMQDLLNPFSADKLQLVSGETIYREQDRVMLTRNMPEMDVFNGDMGIITGVDEKRRIIQVEFDGEKEVVFQKETLNLLTHAWAMSVHKSQGSEYPVVILAADERSRRMLYKRLLYTGISRAKKELYILGDRGLFENGCRTQESRIRRTDLKNKLELLLKKESGPEAEAGTDGKNGMA